MKLPTTVLGAGVAFVQNLKIKSLEVAPRQVLLFGICHLYSQDYKSAFEEENISYFPNWLFTLCAAASDLQRTSLLVECAPFTAPALDTPELEKLPGDDLKLQHTLTRVRPHFLEGGAAQTKRWVLDGIDLRYLDRIEEGKFVKGDKGIRHSLHERLDDELLAQPQPRVMFSYYEYLTGLTNDTAGFEAILLLIKSVSGGTRFDTRKEVLERAAKVCRALFEGVPADVTRALIRHLTKAGYEAAEMKAEGDLDDIEQMRKEGTNEEDIQAAILSGDVKIRKTDYESAPKGGYSVAHLVGEQLVNLAIARIGRPAVPWLASIEWSGASRMSTVK